jgi:hypothetical protein
MKYRNKITEFEVWKWNGYNNDDREGLRNFLGEGCDYCYYSGELVIYPYRNNPIYIGVGDYIVKDINGYCIPISQNIFETLFEKI